MIVRDVVVRLRMEVDMGNIGLASGAARLGSVDLRLTRSLDDLPIRFAFHAVFAGLNSHLDFSLPSFKKAIRIVSRS